MTFLIPRSVAGADNAERLMHRINTERNMVAEMVVILTAHKPMRANDRTLITLPNVNLTLVSNTAMRGPSGGALRSRGQITA